MIRIVTSLSLGLSLAAFANPSDLTFTRYATSELVPSPACLAASVDGTVYVGVDLLGSLGKGADKGRIVRLKDTNQDGKADEHTVFAKIDNPRGLIVEGDKVYVLHTIIPADTNVLTHMNLSVLEDKNGDGIADGPPKTLIKDISVAKHNQDRGADHTTNGIRMGIDGWIYIAVGDFGFVDATGTDGKPLTMLGGGVVRVRPDGTQLEIYTHGTRNIYDVAIDPYLNIYTRGNTNDGDKWNVRFLHHVQSGEYGYPTLFRHFTNEILPALEDFGGGSGTGALFMDEPGWPEKYNQSAMMADWGRNQVYLHRLTPDGATFTQKASDFIGLSQPTDLDVDGSGQLYIAAWDGAGYKGSPGKGFVERVVPKDWTYKPFPEISKLAGAALVKGLTMDSSSTRLAIQQEILTRGDKSVAPAVLAIAANTKGSLASRVAALFTYKQLLGAEANAAILSLAKDNALKEFALRALTDRLDQLAGLTLEPFYDGIRSDNPRVRAAAVVSLGRLGKVEAAKALLSVAIPPANATEPPAGEGAHATPNAAVVIPHLAVHALAKLNAVDACLAALDGPSRRGALWALQLMHDPKGVDGLIAKFESTKDVAFRNQILAALARLDTKEAPYDGSWWWNTRPDTRGPYYVPMKWEKSPAIEALFRKVWDGANSDGKTLLTSLANKNRMSLEGIGTVEKTKTEKVKTVGDISIENVMLALDHLKGDPAKGRAIMKTQACIACHSIESGDRPLGPDLNKVGGHLNREMIAEAILKPDAGIATAWVDVTTNDGTTLQGTLVEKSDTKVVVRNIAGIPTNLNAADVKEVKTSSSTLMGPHLLDSLTMDQFADVIAYLHSLK